MGTGCIITTPVTVNSNPTTITGTTNVCVGLTTTLNSTPAGGTWTSSNGNATIALSTSGVVTGSVAGTSTITYTVGTGCLITTPVTVNSNPTTITGTTNVCVGLTTTLNSTPAGGTWSSSNGNATIALSTSGVITGSVAGTSVITYTLGTGCIITTVVTVNDNPTIITGTPNVCIGLTTTLNSTPAGGTWTSSNGNATIALSTSGVVTGSVAGTSTITYTLGTGCLITTPVTVNSNPTTITGTTNVCVGLTTTLNSTPAGGTWSSSNGNATIALSTSGVVTGSVAGTSVITYTLGTGCIVTAVVTVNDNPTTLTGTPTVCIGLTTTLNSTPAGGTWTSSNGNATIGLPSSGVITGSVAGTSTITYTLGTGCINTAVVTVNSNPTTLTGTTNVCVGLTTTLGSTPTGGTWSSSNGNATIALSTSGVVTGSVAGTSVITYMLGTGCINTTVVTVNPNPTTITGGTGVCIGLTTTLNSTPAGGTWTSSNGNATIDPSTGIVTGSAAGTSTITYTVSTGCINTVVVTVNTSPATITGTLTVCIGLTTALTDGGGGTWSSSNGNAGVGSTGIVTGNTAGTSTITYTLSGGCIATTTVTVNSNPTTLTGTMNVCVGLTTTLNSTPAGGTWTSSNGNATIGLPSSGVITGSVAGTSTITYTLGTGCINTAVVTVNANPTTLTGTMNVCVGLTTTLASTPTGGIWASSNGNATIALSTSGVVTGSVPGTSVITYTIGTGCLNTAVVTVNANPTTLTGTLTVCIGLTTTLNSTPAGGTWSSSNGNATIALSTSGVVTGSVAGTSVITYTLGTGCINTAIVTVNPNPTTLTGTPSVCIGLTTTLNSTPAGGTWTSSNGNATIALSTSGVVTGSVAGTSVITYALGTGCINTAVVTVNSNPTTLTGTTNVCVGLTTTLGSTPAGGTWSSSNGNATIAVSTSGVVTGSVAGTSVITYTLGTGCINTAIVTVNPNPTTITGTPVMCVGLTTTLNSTPAGGTWTSSNGNASIDPSTGVVTGNTFGTSTITYALGTGCINTTVVTVNSNPTTITGTLSVCVGLTTGVASTPGGGTWSSSNGNATFASSSSGVVTGSVAGTSVITYSLGSGCIVTAIATVNPNPTTVTGTLTVCVGLTTSLNSTPAGGTWSSTSGLINVAGPTGVITGLSAGTATVVYTLPTTCIITGVVTVNPLPSAITGNPEVCVNSITALTDAGGGTWSAANGNALAGGTGIISGVTAGTDTIVYTLPTGCTTYVVATIDPLPANITGTLTVCSGLTTALSDITTGGTWSSSASGTASVGSGTGLVTGTGASGTATITYKLTTTGCAINTVVTVNPLPNAISGSLTVCLGLTTTLSDAGGGTWMASNGNATIGSTGIVNGVTPGMDTITYTLPTGCINTAVVTVNSLPAAISGTLTVCAGLTTALSDVPAGGTWVSGTTAVATVGSSSGIVTGGAVLVTSTATITYTIGTGCIITAIVTVNPLPANITGTLKVCSGLTTALTDVTGGGVWSSSASGIASVGSTGIVTGGSVSTVSTATITYALSSTGCIMTAVVTVNPLPVAITGTMVVCSGLTTPLTDASAGGTWSSSASGIAGVGTSGIVTGGSVGVTSTATITYTLLTSCIITAIVTVNPLPASITGTLTVCTGLTTTLSDATTPGTWSSSIPSAGSIDITTGVVTGINAGTTTITYTIPTGCIATAIVTVNPLPSPITGTLTVCQGLSTNLSDASPLGTWSSSASGVASVSGGVVTGTATGAAALTATITYTLPTTCIITAIVTVNPLPAAITGTLTVCSGLTTTLSDATTPGNWTSSASGTASVGFGTGVVTGTGISGTATITYTIPTGCIATAVVTVNKLPATITGTPVVCVGLTTQLTDITTPGTWSSSNAEASVGSTGIVTGIGPAYGTSIITYTVPTGCIATLLVTINPLPAAISGATHVCYGLTTNLSDATPSGTWSSSNGNATIGSSTGIVTGANVGTSTITYTLPTGCLITTAFTVDPMPGAISGTLNVCVDQTTTLTDALTGGTWSTANTAIGTAGSASGGITGVSAGTTVVTYTLPTGCSITAVVTVNPIPAAITGITSVCFGFTTSLSDVTPGGIWSSSATSVATVGSTGNITTTGVGTTTISYTLSAGCSAHDVVTVNPLPDIYAVTGGGTYCEGGVGVHIGLSGSNVGISYLLYYGPSATGYLAGTGSPLDFGLLTVAGIYTVRATNSTTGCTSDMTGNALVVITPTVSPTVSITTGVGDTVCPGTAVTFSPIAVNGGLAPTYSWSVNGVLVSLGNSYTFIPANGDVVSVTMTSNGACVMPLTATGVLKIRVLPDGAPQVSMAIDPGDTICQFALATFTATPTFGGPAPMYRWYVNGAAVDSSGPMFSYYPTTGDIVYCKMVSDYLCRTADTGYSNVAVMTVSPMIIPHVDIEPIPGFYVLAGQTVTLNTLVANAGPDPTYQWEVNGTPVNGATLSTFTSQFNDYDSVTCVVTSSGVCQGISTFDWVYITVTPLGVQQYASGTGDIKLMPNPNKGIFTVKGTLGTLSDEEVSLEVTDMMGQVVYGSKVMAHGGKINEQVLLGNGLANGMYLLNVRSGSDNRVFHFVIEQ